MFGKIDPTTLKLIESKDSEIEFLRERVRDLEKRLSELAQPGIEQRLGPRPTPTERVKRAYALPFPGYEVMDPSLIIADGDEKQVFERVLETAE